MSIWRAKTGHGTANPELVAEIHVEDVTYALIQTLNRLNDGFSYWGEPN